MRYLIKHLLNKNINKVRHRIYIPICCFDNFLCINHSHSQQYYVQEKIYILYNPLFFPALALPTMPDNVSSPCLIYWNNLIWCLAVQLFLYTYCQTSQETLQGKAHLVLLILPPLMVEKLIPSWDCSWY